MDEEDEKGITSSENSKMNRTKKNLSNKTHSCDVYEKNSQNSLLVIHMRSHKGESPYVCDLCEKNIFY